MPACRLLPPLPPPVRNPTWIMRTGATSRRPEYASSSCSRCTRGTRGGFRDILSPLQQTTEMLPLFVFPRPLSLYVCSPRLCPARVETVCVRVCASPFLLRECRGLRVKGVLLTTSGLSLGAYWKGQQRPRRRLWGATGPHTLSFTPSPLSFFFLPLSLCGPVQALLTAPLRAQRLKEAPSSRTILWGDTAPRLSQQTTEFWGEL